MRVILTAMFLLLHSQAMAQSGQRTDLDYGEPREFVGVYVTNFEISYFVECDLQARACGDWINQEQRWLSTGSSQVADQLRDCITSLNGSPLRWGLYAVSFLGRETQVAQPKAFLHDTEKRVLMDDLHAIELIGTDQTHVQNLRRFQRLPGLEFHAGQVC